MVVTVKPTTSIPPPFSTFLKSLMVSVDVKRHVYLLTCLLVYLLTYDSFDPLVARSDFALSRDKATSSAFLFLDGGSTPAF